VARAENALANLRLTRPQGDNAVHYYRQALELDSTNRTSREGLARVVARYVALATRAFEQFELDRAEVLIGRGLSIDGENIDLLGLQAKLRRSDAMNVAEVQAEVLAPIPPRRTAAPVQREIEGESPAELLSRIRGWFR
jgi:hypothetical protein